MDKYDALALNIGLLLIALKHDRQQAPRIEAAVLKELLSVDPGAIEHAIDVWELAGNPTLTSDDVADLRGSF